MTNRHVVLLMIFLILTGCQSESGTEGFAGLGSDASGFAQVTPDTSIHYPNALNQHPDFRIEWWYVTANLESESGETLGIQWTLFRQANSPEPHREGWANQQFWLGHAGLTRADQHYSADIYARGGIGQAGVHMDPFIAWIDHWSLEAQNPEASRFTLRADTQDFDYELTLNKVGPAVLQGDQGVSVKSPQGQASYYMSLPFLDVSGSIQLGDERFNVKGNAWLDREWSSQPLAADQQGWDWFSLHLDQGAKLMLFRLRHTDADAYFSGTYISAEGKAQPLQPQQIQMQPQKEHRVADRQLPVEWRLTIDDLGIDLNTQALNPDAWMATGIAYWEGPITVTGSHSGKGYLEMTGY